MITLTVAWYARSRKEFDSAIFSFTGVIDVIIVSIIRTTIYSILK